MTELPTRVDRIALCAADFPNLGDHLALLPLYSGLGELYPEAKLLVASRYQRIEIATRHGFVDETILYRRADRRLFNAVRRFEPDVSICLRRRSIPSNLCFGRLSGAKYTVGFPAPGNHLLHTRIATYRESVFRPFRYLSALEAMGGTGDLVATVRRLADTGSWQPRRRPYAVMVPAGALDEKHWGVERFARIAEKLTQSRPELDCYAMLGPREIERGDAETLRETMPELEILTNPPLDDLAQIFLSASLVVANDCGPGNLAQMAGVPVVLLFGNWDGKASKLIGWWYHRRPGAICLTTRATAPIDAIEEEAVLGASLELLDDPTAGGSVRYSDDPRPANPLSG
jgi:ADP-heptose:LPS heptosyltransferase